MKKIYSVYYSSYDSTEFIPDTDSFPIFLSLSKEKAECFYKEQIKDAEGIIEQTPTSIKYQIGEWKYSYQLVELELDKDFRRK